MAGAVALGLKLNGLAVNPVPTIEQPVELRKLLGKADEDALRIVRVGASAWGSVFVAMLQDAYGHLRDSVQALGIPEEQLEFLEAMQKLSQGQWEGRLRTEVYTREIVQLMNNTVPDFRALGGESQRQVEFRMVELLNNILLPHAARCLGLGKL